MPDGTDEGGDDATRNDEALDTPDQPERVRLAERELELDGRIRGERLADYSPEKVRRLAGLIRERDELRLRRAEIDRGG